MKWLLGLARTLANVVSFFIGLETAIFSFAHGANYFVAGVISLTVVITLSFLLNLLGRKMGLDLLQAPLWWPFWLGF
jgi:hypothetical protein